MSTTESTKVCERCEKPERLCVCAYITPLESRVHVLILQHPREQEEILTTARIAHLALPNSTLRCGLSWPNLKAALQGVPNENAKRWGVLYLGTTKESRGRSSQGNGSQRSQADRHTLDGIVVLDGSWRQAKSLWWRNPWLLKLKRIVLNPTAPSLYGKARREPRRESLSTLEAVGLCLSQIENRPELYETLLEPFRMLLSAYAEDEKP